VVNGGMGTLTSSGCRPDLVPPALLESVIRYFRPHRIILFGSRARGAVEPDSDIDLLVLIDDDAPREKLTLQAGYEAARHYPHASDIIPCRVSTYVRRSGIVGTLCHTAEHEGVVVYDRE
jgi:nucleotidyltransferase-like protein